MIALQLINVSLDLIDHHPNQPRTKLEGIKELAASIAKCGIIQPPLVIADGDRYITIAGHRRIAAARLAKLTAIDVNVAADWTEAGMLEGALAENMQRSDMTAVDTARGMQTLLDMGVARDRVSQVTGRSEAELAFAESVAQAPKKKADKVATVQASLEEAAALVEFADDAQTVEDLTGGIGSARFAQTVASARAKRERDLKVAKARGELEAAGVRILSRDERWRAYSMGNIGVKLKDHTACPGHAAYVDGYTAEVSYMCTDPKLHGIGKSGAPAKSEKEKEEDRAKRASRAGFKACRGVRHEYAHRLIDGLEAKAGHGTEALAYVARRALEHGIQRNVFGGQTSADTWMPTNPTPLQTLLALAIAQQEKAIDDTVKFNGGFAMRANAEGLYYDLLQLVGYELADCEAAVIKADACRTCGGEGKVWSAYRDNFRNQSTCPACGGSGMRAAAAPIADAPGAPLIESHIFDGGNVAAPARRTVLEQAAEAFNADMAAQGIDAVVIVKPDTGNLAVTELSLVWRHAKDSGRYEYACPGTGGKIAYTLAGANGVWVLSAVGATPEDLEADAAKLAIIAGLTAQTPVHASELVAGEISVRFQEEDAVMAS